MDLFSASTVISMEMAKMKSSVILSFVLFLKWKLLVILRSAVFINDLSFLLVLFFFNFRKFNGVT